MNDEIVVNNLLIKYTKAGEPEGSALLFLHGWRSQKEIWNSIIQKLGNYENGKLQMFAVDLPGFGGSQVPQRPFGVGDYAEVVRGLMEKLEIKNVVVIGHSFGGRVGIKLAAEHPLIVSKLVLVDSAGFAMEESKKNTYSSVAKIVRPFFKPKFMQPLRKKIYQKIGAEDYVATPELQKTFVKVTSEDLTEDMKKITCPTLIVYGENDQDTPVAHGEKMQSLIPASKLEILKNTGHFSFLDNQDGFIKNIQDFIYG